jgi:quercetin dioxygenase-like cupin family protein
MKGYLLTGTLLLATFVAVTPLAQDKPMTEMADKGTGQHLLYQPENIEWMDAPASLPPGAKIALLEGKPTEAEVFTLRIKMPDGYTISPHWHPNVERVTVVSGTFHLGSGEKMDKSATTSLKAGSYTSMPPKMRHYAITEGETVVQLTSIGPWEINYVNPEDDPRKKR